MYAEIRIFGYPPNIEIFKTMHEEMETEKNLKAKVEIALWVEISECLKKGNISRMHPPPKKKWKREQY